MRESREWLIFGRWRPLGDGSAWRALVASVALLIEPRDCWIGVYWDRMAADPRRLVVYVCLVPTLVLRVRLYRGSRKEVRNGPR